MFEIDLLKGRGRPYKTDLKRVVIRLVVILIPIGAAMVYAAGVQHDRIKLNTLERAAQANENRLADYDEDMRFLADLRRQINDVSLAIGDIGAAMRYRLFTSPVLVELAEGLPDEIFIREMDWRRNIQRQRKVHPDTGKVNFDVSIHRTLKLSLCGYEGADNDNAVQAYIARLEAAPELKPVLREIRLASRDQTEFRGKSVTVYELELLLKDQR